MSDEERTGGNGIGKSVSKQTKESQIAGLDHVTFFGLVCILAGIPGMACISLVDSVPSEVLGFLAVLGAAVSVLGNAIVLKGMGYRAVFSVFKQNYVMWLSSVALFVASGMVLVGVIHMLRIALRITMS